jgi:hypothetical protein
MQSYRLRIIKFGGANALASTVRTKKPLEATHSRCKRARAVRYHAVGQFLLSFPICSHKTRSKFIVRIKEMLESS